MKQTHTNSLQKCNLQNKNVKISSYKNNNKNNHYLNNYICFICQPPEPERERERRE